MFQRQTREWNVLILFRSGGGERKRVDTKRFAFLELNTVLTNLEGLLISSWWCFVLFLFLFCFCFIIGSLALLLSVARTGTSLGSVRNFLQSYFLC